MRPSPTGSPKTPPATMERGRWRTQARYRAGVISRQPMRKRSISPRRSCLPNPIDLKSSGYLFAAAFDAVYTRIRDGGTRRDGEIERRAAATEAYVASDNAGNVAHKTGYLALSRSRRLEALTRLKPVSVGSRTGLCQRRQFPPGKAFAGAESEPRFWAPRRRLAYLASRVAKARKVKDYSDGARKLDSRRTAWWGW